MPHKDTPRVPFECTHCHCNIMILPSQLGVRKFCSRECHYAHTLSQNEDRFWDRVKKSDGCWEWQGRIEKNGYGSWGFYSRTWRTHRLSWTLRYGPIPDGLWVLHHCDNRKCVRPDHLFLGTLADNMRDAAVKGVMSAAVRKAWITHPDLWRGEKHGRAKLTDNDVRAIRATTSVSQTELAHRYGVSQATIWRIISRKGWTHI